MRHSATPTTTGLGGNKRQPLFVEGQDDGVVLAEGEGRAVDRNSTVVVVERLEDFDFVDQQFFAVHDLSLVRETGIY